MSSTVTFVLRSTWNSDDTIVNDILFSTSGSKADRMTAYRVANDIFETDIGTSGIAQAAPELYRFVAMLNMPASEYYGFLAGNCQHLKEKDQFILAWYGVHINENGHFELIGSEASEI
jgi:hypothetical protein